MTSVEFRIPMSPTRSFFHQVRFFEWSLRRLGGVYRDALLTVVVGDKAPIEAIHDAAPWASGRRMRWICVPDDVFDAYGIHGTADYRYVPETEADVIILSDADTVLARDIDPLLAALDPSAPLVAGHMAHLPPPIPEASAFAGVAPPAFWSAVLDRFGAPYPEETFSYSMDAEDANPLAPAYFNLGFVAVTRAALPIFREAIFPTQDWLLAELPSNMRCQIAVTLIAYAHGVAVRVLPAEYNAANDTAHMVANRLSAADARVIHYLRGDELKREEIVLPENMNDTLRIPCSNAMNVRLQELLAAFAHAEFNRP